MTKYTLNLGLNDKDTKTQLIDTNKAYEVLEALLKKYTTGATMTTCKGLYLHDDGVTWVHETSIKIELLFVESVTVHKLVDILKLTFNQETIAVQVEDVNSDLW